MGVDSFVLLFVFEQATRVTATSIKLIMIVISFLFFNLLNFIYATQRVISTLSRIALISEYKSVSFSTRASAVFSRNSLF